MPSPIEAYSTRLSEGALKGDPAQEGAIHALERLYQDLAKEPPRKKTFFFKQMPSVIQGVYLHGGVGRGKSMLMDLFYNALPEHISKRRVHFHEFMIGVHDYIHSRRESDGIREGVDATLPLLALRIAERSHVLCFDEFHVTDVADAMILGRLFRCLFEQGVVVVATSNWPLDDLYKGGLQRERFLPFIALLKDKMQVVHLDSPQDYRLVAEKGQGAYFSPLGPETRQKLDEVFVRFTNGETPCAETLEVKGRGIPVPRAAAGVAWFSFADLCEKPHGAEDYLAIAARYHTVFLENVPTLGYDRRNEAKRLMILIDALYEAKTRLVISAEVPPDKLYRGHDHAFEFDRTISRLHEMMGL